jgi:uncharacterized protein YndB with AHSA1/START domain
MADITERIDIDRPAAEVFAYLDDLTHQVDWQASAVEVTVDSTPTRVGMRGTQRRRIPGGEQSVTYEVTEHEPGRVLAFSGDAGPLRISVRIAVAPREPAGCTVEAQFSFRAGGLARFVLPLVRAEAGKEVPADLRTLKSLMESR